jgi:hypothetical protein
MGDGVIDGAGVEVGGAGVEVGGDVVTVGSGLLEHATVTKQRARMIDAITIYCFKIVHSIFF